MDAFVDSFRGVLQNKCQNGWLLTLNDIFASSWHLIPRFKWKIRSILDCLSCNLFIFFVIKWQHSTQQKIDDYSKGPEINFFAVWLLQQNFWGDIRKSAEWIETAFVWPNNLWKAKIDKFQIRIVIVANHQNIFRLQISVGHTKRMQVVKSCGKLVTQCLCPFFRDFEITFFKISEQITSGQVLHHDVNVLLVLENIKQSDDVGVLTHFQDFDFSSLEFHVLNCHFLLAHDFNGDLLSSLLVVSGLDQSKLSFSECLFDFIKVKQVWVANHFLNSLDPLFFIVLSE